MAEAAARPVTRLQDALEDADQTALQTLRTLHAPLIMATAQGRDLQAQADNNRMTRQEQADRRTDAIDIAKALQGAADPKTGAVLTKAAEGMNQGRHPERGTAFRLATIGNAAIVAIAAAVAVAGPVVLEAPPGVTQAAWEAAKSTPVVSAAIKALGADVQRLYEAGGAHARELRAGLALYRAWPCITTPCAA